LTGAEKDLLDEKGEKKSVRKEPKKTGEEKVAPSRGYTPGKKKGDKWKREHARLEQGVHSTSGKKEGKTGSRSKRQQVVRG